MKIGGHKLIYLVDSELSIPTQLRALKDFIPELLETTKIKSDADVYARFIPSEAILELSPSVPNQMFEAYDSQTDKPLVSRGGCAERTCSGIEFRIYGLGQ